jgi:hypothetical protein
MRGVLLDLDAIVDPERRWATTALAWGRDHLLVWWEVARTDHAASAAVVDLQRALRRFDASPEAALRQAARRLAEPWAPNTLVAVAGAAAVFGLEHRAIEPLAMDPVREALTQWRLEGRRVALLTRWPAVLAMGALRWDAPRLDDAVSVVFDPSAGHVEEAATYRAAKRHPALRGVSLTLLSPSQVALEVAARGGLVGFWVPQEDPAAALRRWTMAEVNPG